MAAAAAAPSNASWAGAPTSRDRRTAHGGLVRSRGSSPPALPTRDTRSEGSCCAPAPATPCAFGAPAATAVPAATRAG
eukprot:6818953-Prymnesium_polylepis.1